MLVSCASPEAKSNEFAQLLRGAINWPALLACAEQHGSLGLLASRLNDQNLPAPPGIRDNLHEGQRRQTISTLRLTAEMIRVLERFEALGIEALVTKGPVLSVRCYGEPGKRPYGDIDVVVRDGDMRRCTEAMMNLGYTPRVPLSAIGASKFPGEYAFHRPGTELLIEFHTERTFRYHPRRLPIENLFERSTTVTVDARAVPALSVEDELVLICIHGAKHFWRKLLWIADVAALIAKKGAVDWRRVQVATREVGAERIVRLGVRLAMDALGTEVPQQIAAEVRGDAVAARLAAQIVHRLEAGDSGSAGIFERAAFRVKMRGGWLDGAVYLMRLTLSPTEEDWVEGAEERSWLLDALGRPLRLAAKHVRSPHS